jgi:hypothetical protein
MQDNMFNGRIDILSRNTAKYTHVPTAYGSGSHASTARQEPCNIVSTNIGHTPVSSLFFSQKNIDALQQGICNQVYNRSGGKYNICKQSEIELKIIMRSIYFQSLKEAPVFAMQQIRGIVEPLQPNANMVLQEVRKLNQRVLDDCVKDILNNIQQFDRYKEDVSTMPKPIDLPRSMNNAGRKTLEFQSFF